MRFVMVAALPLVVLAACSKEPEVRAENASVAEVAEKVAAAGQDEAAFSPGRWQTTAKVVSFDMPGMPPQAQAAMKQSMATDSTHETCLTPEQAKKPDPKMFAGNENENCRYDSFTMGGGKIDAVMTCKGGRGEAMKMTLNGTYGPEQYAMATAMDMASPIDPAKRFAIKVEANGKRVGDCAPGSAGATKQ